MTLHLVRTRIDRLALHAFAAQTGTLDDDLGYALHLALRRRFGADAPQPFRVLDPELSAPLLLGYAADPDALRRAPALPDPVGDWNGATLSEIFPHPVEARPMPGDWSPGWMLRFELRLRPVRRHGPRVRAARLAEGGKASGTEHDPFLSVVETLEKGEHDRRRDEIYGTWLAERLAPAAELADVQLKSFRRTRVLRSVPGGAGRGRNGRGTEGPDALMGGRLIVRDGPGFARLLARGVGRHCAFGYGMMLLRPAGPD